MKKAFLIYIYSLLITICCAVPSCTREIDLPLGNASGELVIEGNLTNINGQQTVLLSSNVPFTNTNTYPPVSGANVTMADQAGNQFVLTEGPQGTYSVAGQAGLTGNTYTLNVSVGGKTYLANSTMPAVVMLDSITAKNTGISRGNSNGQQKKVITAWYQDPAGIKNYYRFVVYVNGVQVKSIFAYDDLLTDGKHVGADLREDDIDIYSGDTVTVEMQCIDQPIFTYWYSLMQQQSNGPSGSTAPANPPTNISPATLGYFSAHTTQSLTIIVK